MFYLYNKPEYKTTTRYCHKPQKKLFNIKVYKNDKYYNNFIDQKKKINIQ